MRKLRLYIAASLDGYIASENGGLEWLYEVPNPENIDHGYHDFYKSIGAVIMGMNTYRTIVSFGVDWPYTGKQCYVFTSTQGVEPDGNVTFVSDDATRYVEALKEQEGKDIWLLGGGLFNASMLRANLIDDIMVCIAPAIVGKGIKLFEGLDGEVPLSLVKSRVFDTGMVLLEYRAR